MKIALNTVDLFPGREKLMPFRTILEVAYVMRKKGIEVDVLNSLVYANGEKDYEWYGVPIKQVPRSFAALVEYVDINGYDVFFFPATFRDGLKDLSKFKAMKCQKWAYIPSGVNPKENAWRLFYKYGYRLSRAYLFEAFTPKQLLVNKLKKNKFKGVIGLTDYTSNVFRNHIYTKTILAGKDNFENIQLDYSIVQKENLEREKYYLFMGAPHEVRGSGLLLDAFDRMAECYSNARMVFLMRTDVGSTYEKFFRKVNMLKHQDKITIIQTSLSSAQLKAFIKTAYAVVLPFICIPAEIPITYYEVMSIGTPIVSFNNGGTTKYLADGLMLVDSISSIKLFTALKDLWTDPERRKKLGERGEHIMKKHPNWEDVGEQWIMLVDK